MLKIQKTVIIAAMVATAASMTIYVDPGFAVGNLAADKNLKPDDIVIDPAILTAENTAEPGAASGKAGFAKPDVDVTILGNGDVIFTPGTGNVPPMPVPADRPIEDDAAGSAKDTNSRGAASTLAALVQRQDTSGPLSGEEYCLAGAIYFESKGETLAGQLAVAKVVLARSESGRFPATICGVVHQKGQFSFVRAGRMPAIDTSSRHWKNAVAIAKIALDDGWQSPVEGALFFHARYVNPGWRLQRVGLVDNHVFYR